MSPTGSKKGGTPPIPATGIPTTGDVIGYKPPVEPDPVMLFPADPPQYNDTPSGPSGHSRIDDLVGDGGGKPVTHVSPVDYPTIDPGGGPTPDVAPQDDSGFWDNVGDYVAGVIDPVLENKQQGDCALSQPMGGDASNNPNCGAYQPLGDPNSNAYQSGRDFWNDSCSSVNWQDRGLTRSIAWVETW
jgi:hypothetical protein